MPPNGHTALRPEQFRTLFISPQKYGGREKSEHDLVRTTLTGILRTGSSAKEPPNTHFLWRWVALQPTTFAERTRFPHIPDKLSTTKAEKPHRFSLGWLRNEKNIPFPRPSHSFSWGLVSLSNSPFKRYLRCPFKPFDGNGRQSEMPKSSVVLLHGIRTDDQRSHGSAAVVGLDGEAPAPTQRLPPRSSTDCSSANSRRQRVPTSRGLERTPSPNLRNGRALHSGQT